MLASSSIIQALEYVFFDKSDPTFFLFVNQTKQTLIYY